VPIGGEGLTLQQVMEMMQGFQEAMAASRADQERIQIDLVASKQETKNYTEPVKS